MVPYNIHRFSQVFYDAPEILTFQKRNDSKKQKNPQNLVTGMGYGAYGLLEGVVGGVTGIVVQPVKGARENGVKGAAVGVGKGLIGVISRPVAGTIKFFSYTTQGTINTPGQIYRGIKKLGKNDKNKKKEKVKD